MNQLRQNSHSGPWRPSPASVDYALPAPRKPGWARITRALVACCGDYLSHPARLATRIQRQTLRQP